MKTRMFINRECELERLRELFGKGSASLVVCKGRRRIGKSRLIQEFARSADTFIEFQGLPPREGISNQDQLDAFAQQLASQTSLPQLSLSNWPQAFALLASSVKAERTVILLDEISWMAGKDRDFPGHLKIAWDTLLKKHANLVLVACGSVSSWIDRNIAGHTGFAGRVSLELTIGELSPYHCSRFWGAKTARISATEKLKLLAVTGGVPRYLEEINTNLSAEENIKRMCFSSEGILFSDFDRIFSDVFTKRAPGYRDIVRALVNGPKTVSQICEALGRERGGHASRYVEDLAASGLVSRDVPYRPGSSRPSRLVRFRLRDNYLRFYLKYVEPMKPRIQQGLASGVSLESLVDWEVIMGLQFQNMVLNNVRAICRLLSVNLSAVLSASPYLQKKTQRREACQIDLLVQTAHTLYVCEIKFRKRILRQVIGDVQTKIARLKAPAGMSVRPVLIYDGRLAPGIEEQDFFGKCIRFADLLQTPEKR